MEKSSIKERFFCEKRSKIHEVKSKQNFILETDLIDLKPIKIIFFVFHLLLMESKKSFPSARPLRFYGALMHRQQEQMRAFVHEI